jgi:hypothetical protein
MGVVKSWSRDGQTATDDALLGSLVGSRYANWPGQRRERTGTAGHTPRAQVLAEGSRSRLWFARRGLGRSTGWPVTPVSAGDKRDRPGGQPGRASWRGATAHGWLGGAKRRFGPAVPGRCQRRGRIRSGVPLPTSVSCRTGAAAYCDE